MENLKAQENLVTILPKQLNRNDSIITFIVSTIWVAFFLWLLIAKTDYSELVSFEEIFFVLLLIILAILPVFALYASGLYKVIYDSKNNRIHFRSLRTSVIVYFDQVKEWGIQELYVTGYGALGRYYPNITFTFKDGRKVSYLLSVIWQGKKKQILDICEKQIGMPPKNYGKKTKWL